MPPVVTVILLLVSIPLIIAIVTFLMYAGKAQPKPPQRVLAPSYTATQPPGRKPRRYRKLPTRHRADPAKLQRQGLPVIDNRSDLLRFLGIRSGQLRSYTRGGYSMDGRLPTDHYCIRLIPKRDGSQRILLVPKKRLKALQRRIDKEILSRVAPHPAATAFHSGGGLKVNSQPHTNKEVLVKFDLKDFFPSITFRRVAGAIQKLGYDDQVARNIAAISTVPSLPSPIHLFDVVRNLFQGSDQQAIDRYFYTFRRPHLPQGAPTSPRLSNLVCYRLDTRLTRFAEKFGADYTRYADDITFSGNRHLRSALKIFLPEVRRIIEEEGFRLNRSKFHVVKGSQRQMVTGVVVNAKTTINRTDRRILRSIIHQLEVGNVPFRPDGGPVTRDWMEGKLGYWHSLDPEGARALRSRWLAIRERT